MEQQEKDELQCRKLLLDFYSSELTTHSRLIIGFAVILLTLLQIVNDLEKPSFEQVRISFFGISAASFALWFLLMRHFTYGILANAAIHAPAHPPSSERQNGKLYERMKDGVTRSALKKRILGVIPSCWFLTTGGRITWLQKRVGVTGARIVGVLFCLGLAVFTTCLVMTLVGFA